MNNKTEIKVSGRKLRLLFALANIVIFILTISKLGYFFPFTGLQAIIAIPFTFILVSVITFICYKLTKTASQKQIFYTWILLISFCSFITLALYPQDARPNVINQIIYTFQTISSYDKIKIEDLDLPYKLDDYSRYDCKIPNSQERYIVALYKYQNMIIKDTNYNLYRENLSNIIETTYNPKIKSKDEIFKNLKTGQHKWIWSYLERNKKPI